MKSLTLSEQPKKFQPTPTAVIDIGTNTIRLLIGYIAGNKIIRLINKRCVTRLGKDLSKTGILNSESIKKSIDCLLSFKSLIEANRANHVLAVGTSALREAGNSSSFLSAIEKHTGICVEIISGEREAELTIKGVLSSHVLREDYHALVIDIGGGSTEWIFCPDFKLQISDFRLKNEKMQKSKIKNQKSAICDIKMGSIPIGAVKLSDKFIRHDPPISDELKLMKTYIEDKIREGFSNAEIPYNKSMSLIVTGGTATTIAAMDIGLEDYDGDRIHMHIISRPTLIKILNKLQKLTYKERCLLKGLEPDRADIIISGSFIMLTIMDILNLDNFTVSDYGLLEGLLLESGFRL